MDDAALVRLCRTLSEINQRIQEIAEADAIGDPSLLYDRLTQRERIALETYRDARDALALIREAVEDCAPPSSVPREDYLPRNSLHSRGARSRRLCYRRPISSCFPRGFIRVGHPPLAASSALSISARHLSASVSASGPYTASTIRNRTSQTRYSSQSTTRQNPRHARLTSRSVSYAAG